MSAVVRSELSIAKAQSKGILALHAFATFQTSRKLKSQPRTHANGALTLDLNAVLHTFRVNDLRAVVIGGHAVNFHGYLRATDDIDLILMPDHDWQSKLVTALIQLEAFFIADEIDPRTGIERVVPVTEETSLADRRLVMVGSKYGYLDIFTFAPGLPDDILPEIWNQSVSIAGGRFVSLKWLRKLKEASGRPIDIADLENLPS